jgi:hypothetical protein
MLGIGPDPTYTLYVTQLIKDSSFLFMIQLHSRVKIIQKFISIAEIY